MRAIFSTSSPAPATPATKPAATTTAPSQAGLIDINSASKEQLVAREERVSCCLARV